MIIRAAIFLHGSSLYLHSWARTMDGRGVTIGPYIKVDSNCIPAAKGKFALEVLAASRAAVPDPPRTEDPGFPLLKLAGVKSWQTFILHAKGLELEADDSFLKVIPLRIDAMNYGFGELASKAIVLSTGATLQEIGVAVEEALSRCECT